LDKKDILKKIRNAGVVGAGGAGFPTYKKLESAVEHIIANGAECEPLLYKDREAMLQNQDALFHGLSIMKELIGAKDVTIVVKNKNKDVAAKFKQAAKKSGYNIFIFNDIYPAGDEYILVYEITGRRIPPGGIPLQVGCVVDNVETIVNIANAVDGKPVTEKYVTITGAVKNPITTAAPVGISFKDCIDAAGGAAVDQPVVLTGGIVLPADHYMVKRKTASRETYSRIAHGQCDQCSQCTELCPRYIMGYPIEPHKVMRALLMTGEAKERGSLWAQYCCECNVCSFIACPEGLDPKNICVDAKQILNENQLSRTPAELETLFRDVHPMRDGRQIPITRLYQRLGLKQYDCYAGFVKKDLNPASVIIPLNSHIGQPAQPQVKAGDLVKRGDVIGTVSAGDLGCPVHASIDGRVTLIDAHGINISANNKKE
jgi:Na+-translocating ferredoxin:NAD+ oxidoreductase RnfC subunit